MEDNKFNPTGIPEELDNAAEAVADTAENAVEAVGDFGSNVVENVSDAVSGAGEAVADTAGNVVEAVADTAGNAAEAVGNFGEKVADNIGNAVSGAGEAINNAIQPNAIYNSDGAPVQEGSKVLAIVSLVCGILAIVSSCCCLAGIPNILFGAGAIVTGILTKNKKLPGDKLALAGIITGGIGAAIGVITAIISLIGAISG